MSIVQLVVIAVICLVATAPHGIVLPDNGRDWLSVVYMAIFAGGPRPARPDLGAGAPVADPHRDRDEHGAGLRGVLRGAAWAVSPLTVRMVIGGVMVLGAMLIVEITPRRKIEAGVPHIAV